MNKDELILLLEEMTISEKVNQLLQLAKPFFKGASDEGEITGPLETMDVSEKVIQETGSVLGAWGASETKSIQKAHLENSRLSIPLLFMADVVHGCKTIFPVPLAMGCSWDLKLAEESAAIAAKEASVSGIHVTFAPMVDLVRDPRWGRVMESTGEDPYLNGLFAEAQVKGYQGKSLREDNMSLAACVKHFAAYGASEAGRDYNTVDISERELRENYLPAYKVALEAGCEMVMTAFNTVHGIPATGNKELMRNLLREEWGFNGVVISDWGAVKELIPHGVAENKREAAEKAILAGVDIEMMTTTYIEHIEELIADGSIQEQLLDEAVLRILQLKEKLGLFENPFRGADESEEAHILLHKEHRNTAKQLAANSCVLLKNEKNALPLKKETKLAVIGPFAESTDLMGPWSWQGSKKDVVTLYSGLKSKEYHASITRSSGCTLTQNDDILLKAALREAEKADVIIMALGEDSEWSGEAGSRTNIQLPEAQVDLIQRMYLTGKPVITVLFNGRPLDLHGVIENTDALVEAWFPGTEGGSAVADILYGDVNPSGKLTMSFPYSSGQIPVYYNHYQTGRPKHAIDAQERYVSQYLDSPNSPRFSFGYGLSYTTFVYEEIKSSKNVLNKEDSLTFTINIKNTGKWEGAEIVQFYIRDISGEVVRPVKELKGFEKIYLKPGEEKKVRFSITEKELRYHHYELDYRSDAGTFEAMIGPNSKEVKTHSFQLIKS